jgi:hypothetical protein
MGVLRVVSLRLGGGGKNRSERETKSFRSYRIMFSGARDVMWERDLRGLNTSVDIMRYAKLML